MKIVRIAVPQSLDLNNTVTLRHALEKTSDDDSVTAVVLHGSAATVFCSGLDLVTAADGECTHGLLADGIADLLVTMLSLPKAIIAEVDGDVRGGGVGIVAACDAVVASKRSSFGLPEALYGLIPATIAPVLLQRMTPQKLRLMALTCEAVDADHAFEYGLVDVVTEEQLLQETVQRLACRFRHADPAVAGTLKAFVERAARMPVGEMIREGALVTASLLATDRVNAKISKYVSG